MAKKKTSAAKQKKAELKVSKKLYKAFRKEAKKKDSLYLRLLSKFPREASEKEENQERDRMKRREFIAGLGGAAAWPVVVRGQQPVMPMI